MELTSAAKRLSRLKSTLGLTAASLIDKNYNQNRSQSGKRSSKPNKASILPSERGKVTF